MRERLGTVGGEGDEEHRAFLITSRKHPPQFKWSRPFSRTDTCQFPSTVSCLALLSARAGRVTIAAGLFIIIVVDLKQMRVCASGFC